MTKQATTEQPKRNHLYDLGFSEGQRHAPFRAGHDRPGDSYLAGYVAGAKRRAS